MSPPSHTLSFHQGLRWSPIFDARVHCPIVSVEFWAFLAVKVPNRIQTELDGSILKLGCTHSIQFLKYLRVCTTEPRPGIVDCTQALYLIEMFAPSDVASHDVVKKFHMPNAKCKLRNANVTVAYPSEPIIERYSSCSVGSEKTCASGASVPR